MVQWNHWVWSRVRSKRWSYHAGNGASDVCQFHVRLLSHKLQSQIRPNFGFSSSLTTDRDAGTQPCIPVCTCMDANSQLALLLTVFLCLLTLLSCTAPDKQHQKQHSHQPQRKRPFTCSGIYLFNPLQLLCVCVCICWPPACPPPHLFLVFCLSVGCGYSSSHCWY